MKQIVIGFAFLSVLLITVMTMFSINSKDTRKDEIQQNLTKCIEEALENTINNSYTNENVEEGNKQLVADFTQNLLLSVNSDGKVTVKVINVDSVNGLLDVEVTETFKYSNGNTGSVSVRKTMIVE